MGNYCYAAVCSAALRCPQREERGGTYRGGRQPTACFVNFATLATATLRKEWVVNMRLLLSTSLTEPNTRLAIFGVNVNRGHN